MPRRSRPTSIFDTRELYADYAHARDAARVRANKHGSDFGISCNGREYAVFMLPRRENRRSICEVVLCENELLCNPGHGPKKE